MLSILSNFILIQISYLNNFK